MTTAPPMTAERWARLDDCVVCSAPARTPCVALAAPHDDLLQPHASRTARPDRGPGGELLLGQWLHGAALEQAGRSWEAAMHVAVGGVAVCSGVDLVKATMTPIGDLPRAVRCRRPSCKRIWAAEAWR